MRRILLRVNPKKNQRKSAASASSAYFFRLVFQTTGSTETAHFQTQDLADAFQQLRQAFAQGRAELWVGQREFDKGLKIAFKIADVVAFLVRAKPQPNDASTLFQHEADGVGDLQFAALIEGRAFDRIEDIRRKHVTRSNR